MEKENKQPQVFVARKISININDKKTIIACYVSKATLAYLTTKQQYFVYFIDSEKHLSNNEDFIVESNFGGVARNNVFSSFNECKEYVKTINKKLLIEAINHKPLFEGNSIANKHYVAFKMGEELENKFIPQEERENAGENILIF